MLAQIREKIAAGAFEFSSHAIKQGIIRRVKLNEISEALENGEIIEDYTDDKYSPSCLILGFTRINRPLHVQCSYPTRPLVKIITMYEPDPMLWVDFRVRIER